MEITQGLLKELFDYFPHTGHLMRLNSAGGKLFNSRAGNVGNQGYRYITINKQKYREHRIIWLYVYGRWPIGQIDHINGNKDDNRIDNLREVTNRENHQNYSIHRKGHLVGTTYDKRDKKWKSQIQLNGKQITIGLYHTQQEAHEAYLKALEKINQVLTK